MAISIPEILRQYFEAVNAHDVSAIAGCFAQDAVVHDESEDHLGIEAITRWIEETTEKYRVTTDVTAMRQEGENAVVTALVSGTFDGSPISLDYRFTLKDDRIASLVVD